MGLSYSWLLWWLRKSQTGIRPPVTPPECRICGSQRIGEVDEEAVGEYGLCWECSKSLNWMDRPFDILED